MNAFPRRMHATSLSRPHQGKRAQDLQERTLLCCCHKIIVSTACQGWILDCSALSAHTPETINTLPSPSSALLQKHEADCLEWPSWLWCSTACYFGEKRSPSEKSPRPNARVEFEDSFATAKQSTLFWKQF